MSDFVTKKGRQPIPAENKHTEKVSIYLTPELYKDLNDLARLSRRKISDILFSLASEFVERNRKTLDDLRELIQCVTPIEF